MGLKLKTVTDKVLLALLLLQFALLTNAQKYLQNPKYGDT